MSKIRLLAVISSLEGGGAERQMVLLLRHLDRSRFDPLLCLLSDEGDFRRDVPSDVPVIPLGKASRWDAPKLVAKLARTMQLSSPHVVLSKLDYTNVLVAMACSVGPAQPPVIMVEEAVQSLELPSMSHSRLRRRLLRWAYHRADCVVGPSPGVIADLRGTLRVRPRGFEVIPNMIDTSLLDKAAANQVRHPFSGSQLPLIVAAGRLTPSKGQADLVRAVAHLSTRRAVNLLLLGDGEDRERLVTMVAKMGLAHHVALPGFTGDALGIVAQADVFVSPSHKESFGNAIAEAMGLGIPVISTRAPCGPEWIISHGWTGILTDVRDPTGLANEIEALLSNPGTAAALAGRGRTWARDNYDATVIIPAYQALLAKTAGRL